MMSDDSISYGFFSGNRNLAISQGLRIEGKKPDEASALDELQESGQTTAAIGETDTAKLTFSGLLRSRFENLAGADEEAAALLADQLNQVAGHISDNLGKSLAIKFQNQILKATSNKVNESALSNAVGFFFSSLSETEAEAADFSPQVAKMVQYLNEGDDSSRNSDTNSLKEAMNAFFGGLSVGRADKKFNQTFAWVDEAIADSSNQTEASDKFLILNLANSESLNSGSLDLPAAEMIKAIEWLSQNPDYQQAAKYLEENYQNNQDSTLPTVVGILARENGLEAANEFVQYLNQNLAPEINSTDLTFSGWNLGLDYSTALSEDQVAGPLSDEPLSGGLWIGDSQADAALKQKNHLGLTANYHSTDSATGARLAVPISYDLDELYQAYSASKTTKSIDVYL
jgi:hypothetical protein